MENKELSSEEKEQNEVNKATVGSDNLTGDQKENNNASELLEKSSTVKEGAKEAKDFSLLQAEELLTEARLIIKKSAIDRVKQPIETIKSVLKEKADAEKKELLNVFLESGSEEKDFSYENTHLAAFNELYKNYRTQLKLHYENQEKKQHENLHIKKGLIEQLKALYTQPKENNNQIFGKFREIKDKWNAAGLIPKEHLTTINKTYYHHLDNFFEYLNLNNELKEMNFAQNLETRKAIIKRAKKLLEEPSIVKALNEIQFLHKMWKEEAVPVKPEDREPTWNEFKAINKELLDKKAKIDAESAAKRAENLEKKQGILAKIKTLLTQEKATNKDWFGISKKVDALLEEFKNSGAAPKKENRQLWDEFKEISKSYFKEKNQFYKERKKEYAANIAKKEALIATAKEHKESKDWEASINVIKRIQKDWKAIGFIPRKKSDELWNEFKTSCDYFFDKFKNKNEEEKQAFKYAYNKKEAFLKEIIKEKLTKESALKTIEEWLEKWNLFGEVLKGKNNIDEDFNNFILQSAEKTSLDINEIEKRKTTRLVKELDKQDNLEAIRDEKSKTKLVIDKVHEEILKLENNMGFFANAKADNPLMKNVVDQINTKTSLKNVLSERLKAIQILERKKQKELTSKAEEIISKENEE